MIYLFTWDSLYLVREKTLSWKKAYIWKYGDFNLVHFKNLKEVENNLLSQELLSWWFMWEKKLIIINDFPLKTSDKNPDLNEKQDFLESLLDNIPENNIVIFSTSNPDKRSKFYKKIKKIAIKIEEFNNLKEFDINKKIKEKYNNKISNSARNLIIKYKSWNFEKIIWEIEKLLINSDFIDDKLINNNIFPELEESIFQIIDDIINLDIESAFYKINNILTQINIYLFYNLLIWNLRPIVFILILRSKKIWNISWTLDLKKRAFLANKNFKISFNKINSLYIWLINIDKKMKSWKMIWTEEYILRYEIEKEILKLS